MRSAVLGLLLVVGATLVRADLDSCCASLYFPNYQSVVNYLPTDTSGEKSLKSKRQIAIVTNLVTRLYLFVFKLRDSLHVRSCIRPYRLERCFCEILGASHGTHSAELQLVLGWRCTQVSFLVTRSLLPVRGKGSHALHSSNGMFFAVATSTFDLPSTLAVTFHWMDLEPFAVPVPT
jgi:hypothetical protein